MNSFPNDPDGEVLAMLADSGVDLSQPLAIEFHVAAEDEESAKAIEQTLQAAGFDTEICFDDGDFGVEEGVEDDEELDVGPTWTVYVFKEMIPDHSELVRVQKDLDALAEPHGGFADGWGVLIGDEEE